METRKSPRNLKHQAATEKAPQTLRVAYKGCDLGFCVLAEDSSVLRPRYLCQGSVHQAVQRGCPGHLGRGVAPSEGMRLSWP